MTRSPRWENHLGDRRRASVLRSRQCDALPWGHAEDDTVSCAPDGGRGHGAGQAASGDGHGPPPPIRLRYHGADADRFGGSCDPILLPAFLLPSRPLSARDARPAALLLSADGRRVLGARGGLRPARDLEAL